MTVCKSIESTIDRLSAEDDGNTEGWRAFISREDFAELLAERVMADTRDFISRPSPNESVVLRGVYVYGLDGVPPGRVFVNTVDGLEEGRVESRRYHDNGLSPLEVAIRTLELGETYLVVTSAPVPTRQKRELEDVLAARFDDPPVVIFVSPHAR